MTNWHIVGSVLRSCEFSSEIFTPETCPDWLRISLPANRITALIYRHVFRRWQPRDTFTSARRTYLTSNCKTANNTVRVDQLKTTAKPVAEGGNFSDILRAHAANQSALILSDVVWQVMRVITAAAAAASAAATTPSTLARSCYQQLPGHLFTYVFEMSTPRSTAFIVFCRVYCAAIWRNDKCTWCRLLRILKRCHYCS